MAQLAQRGHCEQRIDDMPARDVGGASEAGQVDVLVPGQEQLDVCLDRAPLCRAELKRDCLQARVENARRIALEAIARALDGVPGKRALHTCFGYAAIVHQRPTEGYPFLAELDGCAADQISIESAQPRLPPEALDVLPHKDVILGVLDLNDMTVESPETVAKRIRAALGHVPAERLVIAPDCGMKYLPRAIAFGKLKAMVDGTMIVRAELGLA